MCFFSNKRWTVRLAFTMGIISSDPLINGLQFQNPRRLVFLAYSCEAAYSENLSLLKGEARRVSANFARPLSCESPFKALALFLTAIEN
jgi:hypothetical protein